MPHGGELDEARILKVGFGGDVDSGERRSLGQRKFSVAVDRGNEEGLAVDLDTRAESKERTFELVMNFVPVPISRVLLALVDTVPVSDRENSVNGVRSGTSPRAPEPDCELRLVLASAAMASTTV